MSYFDPEIYNEKNLTEEHRREVAFWRDRFLSALSNAEDRLLDNDESIIDNIKKELCEKFIETACTFFECDVTEFCVSMIEGYENEENNYE